MTTNRKEVIPMSIDSFKVDDLTVEIEQDECPGNPRTDWDNASQFFISGGRNFIDLDEVKAPLDPQDYSGSEEFMQAVEKEFPGCEILPIYRYEHSGVAYRTTPFHDPWDSGWVGFVLCTRETMIKEWGKKIVTKKVRDMARECMVSEVECYSQWANGEVYSYAVRDSNGEYLDSCGGFYGFEYCKIEAEEAAGHLVAKQQKEAQYQETVMAGLCAGD
jgi:hypothetical protein